MSWFWQQQIEYELSSGVTILNRTTDWKSPTSTKQAFQSTCTLGTSAITNYDEPITSGRYVAAVPDNDGDNEPEMIWSNIDKIETVSGNTYNYATLFSLNRDQTTKIIENTPNIVSWDYNFTIPTGATITGIQVKINKSAYGIHDQQGPAVGCYSVWNATDQQLFNDDITHYTYDRLVTISDTSACTSINNNYAKTYTNESVSPTIIPPTGIWDQTETTYLYGGQNDLWGTTWTPTDINSGEFSLIVGITQHVYRSYINPTTVFHGASSEIAYYNDIYYNDTYYDNCFGYQISKIHDVQIKVNYTEEYLYNSYILYNRPEIFTSANTLLTDDTYFKFQRCFNGICYSYIKNLNDIYNLSLMTGDGKSINNMYNEYNIIDEYIPNLYQVDVATIDNIDLLSNHFTIDNIKLKPNHLVLLMNQSSGETNDIYTVDENYFLVNSNLLSTRDKSYRAKVYVKLGTHNQEQYFLNNEGNEFPVTGETKLFNSGHSYMVKNYINYDIFNISTSVTYDVSGNTVSNPSKILFTNYKVARSLSESVDWNYFDFLPSSSVTINYLDNEYSITSEYDQVVYSMTGTTGGTSGETVFNWSGDTYFVMDNSFSGLSLVSDHILISFSNGITDFLDNEIVPGGSVFNLFTTIKNIDSNYLSVDELPGWIWNSLNNDYRFRIRNLHYCSATTSDFSNYLNVSPYAEILNFTDISSSIRVETKENSDYYRYFDFNHITLINIIGGIPTSYTFTSNSQYQDYKLKPFLDMLGSTPINIYNDAYILSGYTIEEIYDDYATDGHTLSGTYYPIQSSRYKIIPTNTDVLSNFRPYTYLDIGTYAKSSGEIISPYSATTSDMSRSLIVEITDEYMLVEKPRIDTSSGITGGTYDLINVSKIQDISDLLYDLYLGYPHSYYYKYPENIYNKICSQYALILKDNAFVRNLASGILYQKDDLFNFDLFNINIDADYNHLDDVNLTYEPIELIDIGIDKKTKLPIPLDLKNIDLTSVENLWFTGYTHS